MAYKIIRSDEPVPIGNLTIVIYGDPGVAKTSLAWTANEPILLDFDEGVQRSVGRKTTVKFDTWEDTIEMIESEELVKQGCQTLIIDTGGTMLDDFIARYVIRQDSKNAKGGGELSLGGYGAMRAVFDKFWGLLKEQKVDLVMICHKKMKDSGGDSINAPKLTGGAYDIIMAKADLVGFMEINNNVPTLNFNPTTRHFGKNCAQHPKLPLPNFEKEPDKWDNYLGKLIKFTKDHMTKKGEAEKESVTKLKAMKKEMAAIKDLETLKEFRKGIYKLSPIYRGQIDPSWQDKFVDLWAKFYLTKECKTPNDFEGLTAFTADLAKYLKDALNPLIKTHMEKHGVDYNSKDGFHKADKKNKLKQNDNETKKKDASMDENNEVVRDKIHPVKSDKTNSRDIESNEKSTDEKDIVTSELGEKLQGQSTLKL